MKRTANAVLSGAAAGMLLLAGCSAPAPDVRTATPEQIAASEPDPWATEPSVVRDAPEAQLADGTYTGTGLGMDGLITVTLDVSDGRIACVAMTQEGETPSVGGYEAIRDGKYVQLIEAAQGSDFDTIAGATITSMSVRLAVEDALAQASA